MIMPEDFYKVGPTEKRQLDDIGSRALEHDGGGKSFASSQIFVRQGC